MKLTSRNEENNNFMNTVSTPSRSSTGSSKTNNLKIRKTTSNPPLYLQNNKSLKILRQT